MRFFRKKDKQKKGADLGLDYNGAGYAPDQSYMAYDSPDRATFAGGAKRRGDKHDKHDKHDKNGNLGSFGSFGGPGTDAHLGWGASSASARVLQALPEGVLARIFAFVCPHSDDRSYEKCEDSSHGSSCMLCDMRNLAHCVQVCRRWRPVAEKALIRIDSVHYCEREAILADRRKRRSFFDRNAEPEDTADARLKLLCRGLRDDPTQRLGKYVQFLKIPYMLRESHHADIARTVSVMPNLRYVDLPEGLFVDDPIYITLKAEIQAKCPDLRKMTYMHGSERSLEGLASGLLWTNLEVLDLVRIGMDPAMLRHILASLPSLRALKVTEATGGPHAFADEVLAAAPDDDGFLQGGMPAQFFAQMPPLVEIVLTDTRRVTVDGFAAYLRRPEVGAALRVLTINNTGIKPWSLQTILSLAPHLQHLTIVDEVSVALPIAAGTRDIAPLASGSLQTLNYEIKASKGVSPYAGVTRSYYNYLSGSILSGGLPALRAVYVCDAQFPDSLLSSMPLPPPGLFGAPLFGGGGGGDRPTSSSSMSALPMQASKGFLSPLNSPGFKAPAAPFQTGSGSSHQRSSSSHNPFLDPATGGSPPGVLPRPPKPWANGNSSNANNNNNAVNPRFSSNNPFAGMISPQQIQTLEVFTKGDDDLDWSSIVVNGQEYDFGGLGGGGGGGGDAGSRPVSSYGLGADLGSVGARKSVLVNAGGGGFLAVPDPTGSVPLHAGHGHGHGHGHGRQASHSSLGSDAWPRPMSSSSRREQRDLWR